MRAPAWGCIGAAASCGALLLPAAAPAALPAAGARFEIHDHRKKGAGWHVELQVSRRDRTLVRTMVLYDEHCGETLGEERLRLSPEGILDATGGFTATDSAGDEQPGTWELHAEFPTPHRVMGSFRISEPDCEASRPFAGEFGGHDHDHGGHHHGSSDPFDYPDLAAATPAARAKARRMLRRVRAVAAHRFPSIQRAREQGFSRYMVKVKVPEPGVFHLWSREYASDASVLDPDRPESLVWWKPTRRRAAPVLLGFMFRLHPGPHPKFAGSIPSWHSHKKGGDQMTHVWLARGLRGAYANCLPVPELERSIHAFTFEDVHYDGHESQPCAQK